MKQLIIGIAGYANSGKDFLSKALEKELIDLSIKTETDHFAKTLKEECRDFCIKNFSIDPTCCSREEKEKVRDFLVGHAKTRRKISNGTYWIDSLENRINNSKSEVIIIPDVRHAAYEFDECHWIQNKKRGVVIHVSRYSQLNDGDRIFLKPANSEEKENDALVKKISDYSFCWKDFSEKNSHEPFVEKIVQWLIDTRKISVSVG